MFSMWTRTLSWQKQNKIYVFNLGLLFTFKKFKMFDVQILKSTKFNVQTKPTQPKKKWAQSNFGMFSEPFYPILLQGPVLSGKFWWSGPVLGEPFTNKSVWRDDHRCGLELGSKEVNHLAAILYIYAEVLIFMKCKKYFFSQRKGKYFYTFNHFYSEKSSKRANWHKSTTMNPNLPE